MLWPFNRFLVHVICVHCSLCPNEQYIFFKLRIFTEMQHYQRIISVDIDPYSTLHVMLQLLLKDIGVSINYSYMAHL